MRGGSKVAKKGKHRKSRKRSRGALKAPAAFSMVGLVAGGMVLVSPSEEALAASSTVNANVLLSAAASTFLPTATSVIFIDGTNYPNGSERMGTELSGFYGAVAPATYINDTAVYPGTLGLYSGFGAPTGDQSVAAGQQAIDQQIPTTPTPAGIVVVGYSLGAVAASHEINNLAANPGTYPSDTSFVLISNPETPNGGILARMPAGTTIPLLGITGGTATRADGPEVVMVGKQYDGINDAPAYIGNPVADLNAILGAYYLHGDYNSVNPATLSEEDGEIIVTQGGNMTNILIVAPEGELPLFIPLAQAGVPQPILVALDPVTRAVIETGYPDRNSDPSQQVRFALLPPPSAWAGDVTSVAGGLVVTVTRLPGAVVASVTTVPALSAVTTSPVSLGNATAKINAPQGPLKVTPNPIPNPGNDVTQLDAPPPPPPPPPPSTNSGPPAGNSIKTAPNRPPRLSTLLMAGGNKAASPSTSAGATGSSGNNNPIKSAIAGVTTGVKDAIGSVTGTAPKTNSTAGTPSGTP